MSMLSVEWKACAIVGECRELKTVKTKEVWAYAIKLQVIGGVYEVNTREKAVFESVGEGMEVTAAGTFESYNGQLKMVVKTIAAVDAAPGRLAGGAA